MATTRIGIVGCAGRMGRMIIAEASGFPEIAVAGGVDAAPGSAGQDLGVLAGIKPLGVPASADPADLLGSTDVLIDFTAPEATARLAGLAAAAGTPVVIGTTGLDDSQSERVRAAADEIPVIWAPNFSVCVNLLLGLVERVARTLGDDYDIEILEMHHRHKVDAPSGTALALGAAAARGRGVSSDETWVRSRDGQTGPRRAGTIGFAALRGGDVVGDHMVTFAGIGERLELSHKATDRRIFARGAIRAALWIVGRPPGLYSMQDVLGL